MYNEFRKILPRDFKTTLSGIRGYTEISLHFYDERQKVLQNKKISITEKRQELKKLRVRVEQLSILLFTYALYLRFISGDEAIKTAVTVFESLDIKKVSIGAMELSRDSAYYDMGRKLAESLIKSIKNKDLLKMFTDRCHFYEIVDWFKKEHGLV